MVFLVDFQAFPFESQVVVLQVEPGAAAIEPFLMELVFLGVSQCIGVATFGFGELRQQGKIASQQCFEFQFLCFGARLDEMRLGQCSAAALPIELGKHLEEIDLLPAVRLLFAQAQGPLVIFCRFI